MESNAAKDRPGQPSGPGTRGPAWGTRLTAMVAIGGTMGIGLLIISRFVAETRDASIVLGGLWIAACGLGVLAFARSRPELRGPALTAFAATAVGIVAVGWYTGFRETTVDEDVVVAASSAQGAEREQALAGNNAAAGSTATPGGSGDEAGGAAGSSQGAAKPRQESKPKPTGPVSLLTGDLVGADGHSAGGKAEVVADRGERTLTLTNFSVDPGPGVEVYLTTSTEDVSDRIELGGLKGSSGDQQYPIPDDADLKKYDSVVLYCVPFTVRMAITDLK